MKQALFATGNPGKVNRFSKELQQQGIQVITLNEIDTKIEVEETGNNAIENAILKARTYSKIVNIPVFAMDNNLYIDNVPKEKQPGMYVRRVNGKRLSDDEMIEYYSNLVKEYGINGKLTCRWVDGIAIINNGKESTYTWNEDEFYLVDKPSNKINFGYPLDTISIDKKLNKYFTDLTEEDKASLQENEKDIIEFIANNIKSNK